MNTELTSKKDCLSIWITTILETEIKDIINPYNCLLRNAKFLIKTSNE